MSDNRKSAGARLVREFSTETILAVSRGMAIATHPTFAMPESLRMQDLRATGSST